MPEFVFDAESAAKRFMRPELLTHPHIPGGLAGVNPRSIMGREWWDEMRRDAYQRNNGHCFACGGFSGNDPYKPWLEAHECYDFDYDNKVMKFREVSALCHSCHSFIHSGRLWALYLGGDIPKEKIEYVLDRGMELLKQADLKPFFYTRAVQYMVRGMSERSAIQNARFIDKLKVPPRGNPLHVWKMVFDGRAYYSLDLSEPWPLQGGSKG